MQSQNDEIKKTMNVKSHVLLSVIFSFFILHSALGQGSLTPPGAPGPTMLTLSQIEPRTPISSAPITITQPGSYYLATNLTVSGGTAIVIQANGVTLDLRGFTISSTAATAAGTAILLNGSVTNIAIYDGQIMSGATNSSTGIFGGSGFVNGISAGTPYNVRVKNISVCGVMNYGIFLGANSSVAESCVVNVAGTYGI